MDFYPLYLMFIPILTAVILYFFHMEKLNYIVFLSQAILTWVAVKYAMFVWDYGVHRITIGGWDALIGIGFKNDRLSITLILLTVFLWWVTYLYIWNFRRYDFKFLFFLTFLQGCFLGLLQTNDFFNMFILIELITIISTILIIYKKDGHSIRTGFYYLMFNGFGMLFFLLGVIILYYITGTVNMELVAAKIKYIDNKHIVYLAFVLMVGATGVKSAFFPVYNWLPRAHGAAPACISALLSGLLVKSGIYMFIRLNQVFMIRELSTFFAIIGLITAFSGVMFAMSQKDIKQILAFSTISQLGLIILGVSIPTPEAYYGGLLHLVNHAIVKALLFLCAGTIINKYSGERRVTSIRGVFRNMPLISIAMIVGMLSITGAPFFNGYASKTLIKYGIANYQIVSIIYWIVNLGTILTFVKLSQIFFNGSEDKDDALFLVGEEWMINVGIVLLASAALIIGMGGYAAVLDVMGYTGDFTAKITLMSPLNYVVLVALGAGIYKILAMDKNVFFKKLRQFEMSFSASAIMLVSFISFLLFWSNMN